ncbi:MAG TPA: PHB depolymerase family esterase, partial [Gemmatimonadaceae bacterium]|nr:PHB depolymerase family esterase [Gemmatimonadaceae bacterium]
MWRVAGGGVHRSLTTWLALAVAPVVLSCSPDGLFGVNQASGFDPGTGLHTMSSGSLQRDYILHVPAHRPTSTSGTLLPYPLVIVLHGSSGSADDIRGTTQMDSVSEAVHWVVAYPDGVRGEGGLFPSDWDAGTCCGAASRENIDDVGFIAQVMDELTVNLPIDTKRIYVVGFSDGGRMAHTLACALASKIAAIGVVSGSIADDSCAPSRPVPLIAIHGTDDDIVPYDEDSATQPPSAAVGLGAALPPSVQFWLATNGCGAGTSSKYSNDVTHYSFTGCTGADVAFYSIAGGVHTWPVGVPGVTDDPDSE